MPTSTPTSIFDFEITLMFIKGSILLILIFYTIFSLIVIRQVDLMGKTLTSNISGVVKAMAILNAGFAIGLIVLSWGLL